MKDFCGFLTKKGTLCRNSLNCRFHRKKPVDKKLEECSSNSKECGSKSEDCPICLCKMDKEKEITITKCNHKFHKKCMDKYTKKSKRNTKCPLCRTNLKEGNSLEEPVEYQVPWLNSTVSIDNSRRALYNSVTDIIDPMFQDIQITRNYFREIRPRMISLTDFRAIDISRNDIREIRVEIGSTFRVIYYE